jgi:glycerate dehydrogenase
MARQPDLQTELKMNIVVLDGHTLNPGDLSWDGLSSLAPCWVHNRTPVRDIVAHAAEADILVTNKAPLSRESIERLPQLKFISVTATGYNIVDVAAARERGIPVSNVPAYGTRSVAQMTLALILELTQHVGDHARTVREGRWSTSPDWCYWDHPLVELDGKTLGIVGLGRIGLAVAELAQAFGMRVMAHKPKSPSGIDPRIAWVDLDTIFKESDVVSLHCPLNDQTRHIVNAARLAMMKKSAFLVNTSRGPLVDEAALAQALHDGRIAGAAMDVLSTEPPAESNPLLGAPRCIITPHIAWATHSARSRLMQTTVENVKAFLAGSPKNVVN